MDEAGRLSFSALQNGVAGAPLARLDEPPLHIKEGEKSARPRVRPRLYSFARAHPETA